MHHYSKDSINFSLKPVMAIIVVSLGLLNTSLNAQTLEPSFPDDFYVRDQVSTSRPVPYVHERESDILWSKRVWRTIDLREKFNHPLYYPETPLNNRKSLFDVVKEALLSGELIAFGNAVLDDGFNVRMRPGELDSLFNPIDSIDIPDPYNPDSMIRQGVPRPLTSNQIKAWWIKEDWFWDRQRSVMDVRIIGICPLQEHLDPDGQMDGYKPLFWLYFDQLCPLLAQAECYNTRNDAQRLSYDDVFRKRMFHSYIRQESNVYNRAILDYAQGLDAVLESERIKQELFNSEHDYWHF